MRKFIFIAGFVLASTAAQAGDRSLSLGGVESQRAPAPAKATDVSPQAAEAPRYVERPAVVEPNAGTNKADMPRAESPTTETSRTTAARSRAARMQAARMQRASAGRASVGPGRPMAQRTAMMSRGARPLSIRYGIKARIISALHRHGIYW